MSYRHVSLVGLREMVEKLASAGQPHEVTTVRHIPAREAEWTPMPAWVRPELAEAYRDKGVKRLYTHQAEAAERVRRGENIVVVTPTSSGKTLCYNLPVINAILENADTRALYLFPTKALAQDQLAELHDIGRRLDAGLGVYTYDGDTSGDARKAVRRQGHIVITNPDMLHTGILPHHTKWTRLFENLRYVVLDELHTYRGVFGSHVTNLLRRLRRIARFYGKELQFICSSATIANPDDLARRLLEADVTVLDRNGAPAGEKFFVFYNPPVVNRYLGIRRSYINESAKVAREFLIRGLQTITFANSRLNTEVILTYLQEAASRAPGAPDTIRGYRGGYLPLERREIERGLREGSIRGVVATNALELGIDIGSLDVSVMAGYPGTIASTWQRAGRAGRRTGASCAVLVASSLPLDQFIVNHPDYFFGSPPEHAFIQPDNLEILVNHLKAAAFELPLASGERFGDMDLSPIYEHLVEAGFLHRSGEFWHWTNESYPADAISLRAVTSDNFVIIDETETPRVIGEVDFTSALSSVHPKAIYIHEGQQYHVERLDFEQRKAYVRRVRVDHFTQAVRYTEVRVLELAAASGLPGPAMKAHGDVLVRSRVVGFKKIKFFTLENIGSGKLDLPENEMHTTAFWLTLRQPLLGSLPFSRSERQAGLFGLLYALESIATLLLMCDRRDLDSTIGESAPPIATGAAPQSSEAREPPGEFFEPNLYLYDAYPGGIGFSEPLFAMHELLLGKARDLIAACACERGCPSCVGPAGEAREHVKEVALAILNLLSSDAHTTR